MRRGQAILAGQGFAPEDFTWTEDDYSFYTKLAGRIELAIFMLFVVQTAQSHPSVGSVLSPNPFLRVLKSQEIQ